MASQDDPNKLPSAFEEISGGFCGVQDDDNLPKNTESQYIPCHFCQKGTSVGKRGGGTMCFRKI
jgi:hypothetical protein